MMVVSKQHLNQHLNQMVQSDGFTADCCSSELQTAATAAKFCKQLQKDKKQKVCGSCWGLVIEHHM